jgi:hypothetical protein
MSLYGYPITRINYTRKSLADDGYKLWYWQLEDGAYDCPLEPLTQEFWRARKESRLAYGILLPTLDEREFGDLLILATQPLALSIRQNFGGLTVPQLCDLNSLILKLNLPQVTLLRSLKSEIDRLHLFEGLERAFEELVLPRKNEQGEYYRRLQKLEPYDSTQAKGFGGSYCPRCDLRVAFGKGLDVMKAYRMDAETIFVLGRCHHCQNVVTLSINPHFSDLIW